MSNEAAREIISTVAELLSKASAMIDDEKQSFIYHYPLERCPDDILKKWLKQNEHEYASMVASLEVERELKTRERLNIKIEVVK
jgi:hypothetical protein